MLFSPLKSVLFVIASAILATHIAYGADVSGDRSVTFDSRGTIKIDGQLRFIIGCYEYPEDDAKLKELADAGFNLVRITDPAQLDRLGELNLYAWSCIHAQLKEGDEAKQKQLSKQIDAYKNHPAMLIWELPDEALWNVWFHGSDLFRQDESKALAKKITASKASDEQKAEWEAMRHRATGLHARSLYKKAEAIYDQLWEALGEKSPFLDTRFSGRHAETITLAENLQRGCKLIREQDPVHPIWQNHAPRNSLASLRRFNQYVDAVGCDIYPVPMGLNSHSDLIDQNITNVGAYTRRMRAAAEGKSCWMVLQGFGWADLHEYPKEKLPLIRRPNWSETRFMAYDSIVNGANAILYWGTHRIEKDSQLWKELVRIGKELRSLEPLLVGKSPQQAPIAVATETYGSIDPEDGPKLLLRHHNKEWLLIAVNERKSAVPFTVKNLPNELEGKSLKRLHFDETVKVENGSFQDGILPHGVHIYIGTSN